MKAFVPVRSHLGFRSLDVEDGTDVPLFIGFAIAFPVLLALSWPLAFLWLLVTYAGMETLRRAHNNEPA